MATTTTRSPVQEVCSANHEQVVSRKGTPTWEIAYEYPRQGEWTEAEYLSLNTGRLVEFVDGCLEFLPMPPTFHQRIVRVLMRRIEDHLAEAGIPGEPLCAPCQVRLWEGRYREPDVFYVRPERVRDPKGQPQGADLVIEIVSEGAENRTRDLVTKRQEYAEAGIPEYWIIDPHLNRITVLILEGPEYRVHGEFGVGTTATSVLLTGFEVSVDSIFLLGDATELQGSPNGS